MLCFYHPFLISSLIATAGSLLIIAKDRQASQWHHHSGSFLMRSGYFERGKNSLKNDSDNAADKAYCYDSHRHCDEWANATNVAEVGPSAGNAGISRPTTSNCPGRPRFMVENCRASCGECDLKTAEKRHTDLECFDSRGYCHRQAMRGRCESAHSRRYMEQHCRLSCQLCSNGISQSLDAGSLQRLFPGGFSDCMANITYQRAWFFYEHINDEEYTPIMVAEWILASAGFTLVSALIVAILRTMWQRRVSRKFYSILLNRVVGDWLLTVLIPSTQHSGMGYASQLSAWMHLLMAMSFWAMMCSYVALSLLKLYGVARPLHFRNAITLRRCIQIVVACWASFAIFVAIKLLLLHRLNLDKVNNGIYDTAAAIFFERVLQLLPAIVYAVTVTAFLLTVALIHRAKHHIDTLHKSNYSGIGAHRHNGTTGGASAISLGSHQSSRSILANRRRFRIPLAKLSLNVATLAVFHLPLAVWSVFDFLYDDEEQYVLMACASVVQARAVQWAYGVVYMCVLLRIVLDAIAGFALDRQLRQCLYHPWFCCTSHEAKQNSAISDRQPSAEGQSQPLSLTTSSLANGRTHASSPSKCKILVPKKEEATTVL